MFSYVCLIAGSRASCWKPPMFLLMNVNDEMASHSSAPFSNVTDYVLNVRLSPLWVFFFWKWWTASRLIWSNLVHLKNVCLLFLPDSTGFHLFMLLTHLVLQVTEGTLCTLPLKYQRCCIGGHFADIYHDIWHYHTRSSCKQTQRNTSND